jgi:RNA ligase (TIGR02306 family)
MSNKLASIEIIKEILPINGADKIELARILNYQTVIKKGSFNAGDKICFISIDTVLPDKEWAAFYKSKSSRVKSIKLRGCWSQGIVEDIEKLGLDKNLEIGTDVSENLGISHWEPPAPQDLNAKCNLRFGIFKTDEERVENLDNIPYGQEVAVTLKIDGSSISLFCKNVQPENIWETGITSRSLELKTDCINNYTRVEQKYNILSKLKDYCIKNNKSLCLRGELYGAGCQKMEINPHSKLPLDLGIFSVLNLETLKYERLDFCIELCKELEIPIVPILEKTFLTSELIKKYSEDLEKIDGKNFEGCVFKGDSFSFKVINKHYDSKK